MFSLYMESEAKLREAAEASGRPGGFFYQYTSHQSNTNAEIIVVQIRFNVSMLHH